MLFFHSSNETMYINLMSIIATLGEITNDHRISSRECENLQKNILLLIWLLLGIFKWEFNWGASEKTELKNNPFQIILKGWNFCKTSINV